MIYRGGDSVTGIGAPKNKYGRRAVTDVYIGKWHAWNEWEYSPENVVAFLHVTGSTDTLLTATLSFTQSTANGVVVDFGDGSTPQTYSGTSVSVSHKYPSAGYYKIKMEPADGVTWQPGVIQSGTWKPFLSRSWITRFIFQPECTGINQNAFTNQSYLVRVDNFPSNITTIPNNAFSNCGRLEYLDIPDGVQTIGAFAFSFCSKLPISKFPSALTSIGSEAFSNCSKLTVDKIPAVNVGEKAFQKCIGLPKKLEIAATSLTGNVFSGCTQLEKVWLRNTVETITVIIKRSPSTQEITSYLGPFTGIGDSEFFAIYAEPASQPSGWDEHFECKVSTNVNHHVVWGVSEWPGITLLRKWDEATRSLTHIETVANGNDYIYDDEDDSLEYL